MSNKEKYKQDIVEYRNKVLQPLDDLDSIVKEAYIWYRKGSFDICLAHINLTSELHQLWYVSKYWSSTTEIPDDGIIQDLSNISMANI